MVIMQKSVDKRELTFKKWRMEVDANRIEMHTSYTATICRFLLGEGLGSSGLGYLVSSGCLHWRVPSGQTEFATNWFLM